MNLTDITLEALVEIYVTNLFGTPWSETIPASNGSGDFLIQFDSSFTYPWSIHREGTDELSLSDSKTLIKALDHMGVCKMRFRGALMSELVGQSVAAKKLWQETKALFGEDFMLESYAEYLEALAEWEEAVQEAQAQVPPPPSRPQLRVVK